MSLSQEAQIQTSVFLCNFECFIRQANIAMKFPCSYFVEWRTINSKNTVKTQRHNPIQSQVTFDEKIQLELEMLYDNAKMQYLRRETIVELFLISKSRPDQNKLVGRVNIDLGKVINVGMYLQPTEFKLNFCSIEGTLIMQFKALQQKLTKLTIQDLDKSSFMDFISQAALKTQNKNQSMIISRYENQSLQRKQHERVGRSQIRGSSPHSTSVMKSGILSKSTDQVEKKINMDRQTIGQFHRLLNDESEAKNNINTSNIKIDIEKTIPFEANGAYSGVRPKQIMGKRSFEMDTVAEIRQKQVRISQDIIFQDSNKKDNSPTFPVDTKETLFKKESQKSNDKPLENIDQQLIHQMKISEVMVRKDIIDQAKNEEIDNLKHQLVALRSDNDQLTQQKASLLKQIQDSASNSQAYKLQIQKLQQDINQANKALETSQSQRNRYETTFTSMKQQYNKVLEQSHQQAQLIDELNTKINSLETTNKQRLIQFQAEEKHYSQKIGQYEQFIKKLEAEGERLIESIKTYEATDLSLKTKLEELQNENNHLATKLSEVRKELEGKRNNAEPQQTIELEERQREIQQMRIKIDDLQASLQAESARCSEFQREITDFQSKYFQLQGQYDEQLSINQNLQEQLNQKEEKPIIEEVVEEVVLNHSEVLDSKKDVQVVPAQVQKLKLENQSLVNEIQFLKSKAEMQQREQNHTIEILRSDNQSLKEKNMILQSKILSYSATEAQLQQIISANKELLSDNNLLKEEISQLHKELSQAAESSHFVKVLQQQNEQLREQTHIIEGQVQCYEKELEVLKDQIVRIRQAKQTKSSSDKTGEYEQMISKLNGNLEEQINQNTELQEAIVRYMEKEAMMKETLAVLDNQSKEIYTLFQEKEQNQKIYLKTIDDLQAELLSYKSQSPLPNQLTASPSLAKQQKFQQQQQLILTIEELKQANSKLNDELMHLTMQFDDAKAKLEAEITNLTESALNAESSCRKLEETHSAKIKEYERSIKNRDIELEVCKSRVKDREENIRSIEIEMSKLRNSLEAIEQEKFNLESSNNQKQIRIIQLQQELQVLRSIPIQSEPAAIQSTKVPSQLISQLSILQELKEKLLQKNLNSDWDSLLQNVLDRSINGEDTSKLLNLEEKSRLLSKELQKMKAQLLKSDWRNQQEKIAAMGLFKKCESIVTQLITAAQSLNQNQSSFL